MLVFRDHLNWKLAGVICWMINKWISTQTMGTSERDITADTAIRLGRYFRTEPRFWLNLQAAYDLSKAEKTHSYKKIVPRTAA